ncbi:MAG: hypothetical protein ACI4HO_10265 [Ruminococcus sp.]
MDKFYKRLVSLLGRVTKNVKPGKGQLIMSCISLFLTTAILISTVFSWFCLQDANTIGTMNVDAGNGLRLNYNNNNSNVVEITQNMSFLPVSSVKGQNLYFPSDGSFFTKDTLEEKTKEITYRAATAEDKNFYFLQFDFALTSYTDGTEVFIDDEDTYVRYHDTQVAIPAMRVAFLYDNGKNSVVMNPTKKERSAKAVDLVNFGTGECLKTTTQVSRPFSYYTASNGQSLFTLGEGETQTMSVVIWLEGTDKDCVNEIIGKYLDINIKFTTTWNNMDEIKFKDVSSTKWISDKLKSNATLQLVYTDATNAETTYDMVGSGEEFTCKLPKTIDSGITFRLTTESDVYEWTTEPDGTPSTYRGKNVTYYAKGTADDPRGYWKTSDTDSDIEVDVPDEEW